MQWSLSPRRGVAYPVSTRDAFSFAYARIDQDPTISKDLSLWNQQGSQVLRGNLLTVPIDGAFLYVEPLYIQATGGKIPELKRVIVATQKDVGYGTSLAEALGDLFGPDVAALAPAAELAEGANAAAPLETAPGANQLTPSLHGATGGPPEISGAKKLTAAQTATAQSAADHPADVGDIGQTAAGR